MTTDVILLFFWALALLAYVKMLRGSEGPWAALLAVSLGFGLLDKYAMAYFVAGIVLAGFVSRDARALLKRPVLWIAVVVGVAMLTPNILWNLDHGFATAKATAAYARGSSPTFHIGSALGFIASQFGVVGPITFGVLLILFARLFGRSLSDDDRAMLAFAAPPLFVVIANAIYSGQANANWAAPAMISAFVVTAACLVREGWWRLLFLSVGIGMVVQAVMLLADPFADRLTIPGIAHGDIFPASAGLALPRRPCRGAHGGEGGGVGCG
ncbi:MAG: glycosyltransferase family 39 protein [Bauldia sp.]